METGDVLQREIRALAFDQYGTIVDMQKGLAAVVTPFLKEKGWDGKPNSFVTWWRRTACFLSVVYRNQKEHYARYEERTWRCANSTPHQRRWPSRSSASNV